MASNEEMRRLVLHAADRLAEEVDMPIVVEAVAAEGYRDTRRQLAGQLRSQAAAMALAEATLRMVAACMAVEGESEPHDRNNLEIIGHIREDPVGAAPAGVPPAATGDGP